MTKKKVKKTKAIVKKEDKKELAWAGAQDLFKKYGSEKDQEKRNTLLVTAQALKITPFGVNLLGGLPYVNNMGLKQKSLTQYHPGANFEYNWVKRSEDDNDKAICEARIILKGKPLTPWIAGEASPASMKMGTLKGYQNHMAQTRAENRCVRYLDGLRMHNELFTEIAKMQKKGEVDDKTASDVVQSTTVTAEEMTYEPIKDMPRSLPMLAAKTEKSNPIEIAASSIKNVKSLASLNAYEKRINEHPDFNASNKKYLLALVATMRKKIK